MHQLWTERDPRVPARRRIGADGRPTVKDISQQITEAGIGGRGLLAVEERDSAQVLGYCGLVDSDCGAAGEPEIAFELLRRYHGHGYATEAARAVVERARRDGHQRVWATVWDWNLASRRVLTKLGFTETGQVGARAEHGTTLVACRALERPGHI